MFDEGDASVTISSAALPDALEQCLAAERWTSRAEHSSLWADLTLQDEALRFLKAVKDISFDLGSYDYVHLDRFESEAVSAAAEGLERSLDAIDEAAVPAARAV